MNAPSARPALAQAPADIDLLRTFLAIAETGSFSKAAERVFRTPSAVSMQVKKLEETLGTSVFERDSRSVKLTQSGEMLVSYARRILALSNEMVARFVMPEMEGTVCLGAPDDYGERIMPQVLKRFAETHPNVQVNVIIETSDLLIKRFENGQLDVMVYTAQSQQLEEGAQVLLEEDLVWAGVRGGCAWERDPLPLSMWEEGCAWRSGAVQALTEVGRSYRTAYMTAHTQAQRAAIASDLAIAPFPKSFISEPLIELGEKQGLPKLCKYQIRMRVKDNPGCCSRAVADHVTACFDEMCG
ncbi:LysR family transcriptional regulator [Oricola indica]|uniref:LysR family transcriptional regulator n=1 Tax=Oricola indica TaxID=2872591 RepID=UPI003CCBF0C2